MQDDQPVRYMDAITERYARLGYTPYRWYHAEDSMPCVPLAKPLSECRIGALTTSGVYAIGQVAFHYKDDASLREIPSDTEDADLRFSHLTQQYLVNAKRDPNCIVPLKALRKLVHNGVIGALADAIFSCMGGIYSQRRVREELIPVLHRRFVEQKVDAVLLAPM
jgi:D-proline reductase (dithiol) PrdB